MRLIYTKKYLQTEAGDYILKYFLTGDRKTGYGITLIEYYNRKVRYTTHVEKVSHSKRETLALIQSFSEHDLSPIHLRDAVVDYMYQKLLECSAGSDTKSLSAQRQSGSRGEVAYCSSE